MTVFLRIDRFDQIPDAISRLQAAGVNHRVPLLQAVYHGGIAHIELQRTGWTNNFKRWSAIIRLPGLALIGDDDHASQDGPDTWPIARRAIRWARFILIHGGAGDPAHYEFAITLAKQHKRVLMIECSSVNVLPWAAAAERWGRGATGQIMMPPPGCPHPSLSPEGVH